MTAQDVKDRFEVGDRVVHKKWGVGTILHKTGYAEKTKVIVNFPDEGEKKLMLKFANLKKAREKKIQESESVPEEDSLPSTE